MSNLLENKWSCLSAASSSSSPSSRSLTRPVQQQWWSWWSSPGPPSPHIISGEAELVMVTVRFVLVGACYISEEHARLSGPPHHRDMLGEETCFSFVSCACVRWACCGRNAVVPKPTGRACQEGGMHPSPVWVSALFWWWWSFPGNGCWLMVALLVLRIWLADMLARCQEFRSVLGSIGELLCICCRVLAFVLLREETCLFGELPIPIMHQGGRLLGSESHIFNFDSTETQKKLLFEQLSNISS